MVHRAGQQSSADDPARDSGTLAKPGARRVLVTVFILAAWCLIAGRLIHLQWLDRSEFAFPASRQRTFVEVLLPRPGDILDRHGRVLATSVPTRSLWVDLGEIPDPDGAARRIAGVLRLDAKRLRVRFREHRGSRFLWVKRRLTEDEAAGIRRLKLPPAAFGFRDEYRRRYPQGPLAAHVIGLRDVDGRGRGGIEQAFDGVLGGTPGRRAMLRDARGRVVEVLDDRTRPPRDGRDVRLTLDVVLQIDVEREIDALMARWKPWAAGAIVMDPGTGELLAMASRPAFDPNRPVDVAAVAWKNVNVAWAFEPGSTFKPFVVGWALQQGLVRPDEPFDCEHGRYRMGGRLLHDHHPYGTLSVKDILVKSSNIGMAKIGERLTNAGLYAAATRFGFGRPTGSGLPGEIPGMLRPLKEWTGYSTGSVPMGQEIGVTPLQLITAHAALANGGTLISPRLVSGVRVSSGINPQSGHPRQRVIRNPQSASAVLPRVVSDTVSPRVAHWLVREAMTDVVRRGTGRNARLEGYTVFGKTGTAQKIDPATGKYSGKRHVCSFVGGAPADDPRVLVLVVVDEPTAPGVHYGGTVAAPAAARMLRRALGHLQVPPRVAARPR